MNVPRRMHALFALLMWIAASILPTMSVNAAQQLPQQDAAQQIFDGLTVEERVGQLFLLSFEGRDLSEGSPIQTLISQYHIGGLILRRDNDNFIDDDRGIESTYQMLHDLQMIEWDSSSRGMNPVNPATAQTYLPLFIGISQEGDGYPNDQILSGLTRLPSQMAIGATWDENYAYLAGDILGSELSQMGFNLLMGPTLDVLNVTPSEDNNWLGIRSFGGDPYWVGKMGQQYIAGLHDGSSNKMVVIAKNFPGSGSTDRSPELEVATVRKSLEQLKQIELAPFFDVTGRAPQTNMVADGLLISHIRYQGFQGNIRATTRPVSFDQVALDQLFALPELTDWEDRGGLIVSDNLMSEAVRKFYDPNNLGFDARQVATNALQAGNDLLYLNDVVTLQDEGDLSKITDTLSFFTRKYQEDQVFAARVDEAVMKILAMKLRIYPDFQIDQVLPSEEGLAQVGQGGLISFQVAQDAVTLINPGLEELNAILPVPPETRERILFISDEISAEQCSRCERYEEFSMTSLQDSVLKFYGPQGSAQVVSSRLVSHTFAELETYLGDTLQTQEHPVIEDLMLADWVVFSMLDIDSARGSSLAFKNFLDQRSELLRNKKVIVFAFNAPYFLDATDIANLTAYYALYSKETNFVDVAARILFNELSPSGYLPISVPSVGYDIMRATAPDADQVIPLMVDLEAWSEMDMEGEATETDAEPMAVPADLAEEVFTTQEAPSFEVGDSIPLKAGPIYDNNGNYVPDGTVVKFVFSTPGEEAGIVQLIETVTTDGMARTAYPIKDSGLLEIQVRSEPAELSTILLLDIPEEGIASITQVEPLPTPEETEIAAPATVTPEPTLTATAVVVPTEEVELPVEAPRAEEWILSMVIAWLGGAGVFAITRYNHNLRWQVRRGLTSVIMGVLGFCYLVLGFPGSESMLQSMGEIMSTILVTLVGVVLGFAFGWLWRHEFE
ncbi:MAG: hypothetical protein JW750_03660 [Anaerolineaceae bacterium]|nr:hypothetical protein [Anaerolineaceae bacterium]